MPNSSRPICVYTFSFFFFSYAPCPHRRGELRRPFSHYRRATAKTYIIHFAKRDSCGIPRNVLNSLEREKQHSSSKKRFFFIILLYYYYSLQFSLPYSISATIVYRPLIVRYFLQWRVLFDILMIAYQCLNLDQILMSKGPVINS